MQALSTKFVLNQKWWLTYAGVLSAAYLYLRPLIRRRLGSAEQGAAVPECCATLSWFSIEHEICRCPDACHDPRCAAATGKDSSEWSAAACITEEYCEGSRRY